MKYNDKLSKLIIGATGIVYGDIGTSPLYALKKCFLIHNIPVSYLNILGIVSLIFWVLFFIVTLKYVCIILNADNKGEGGILALSSLIFNIKNKKISRFAILFGILGTALFYGDGVITPAISILSAVEGLSLISHKFDSYIPAISIILLIGLFLSQRKGSNKIGLFFGPIMVLWFLSLSLLGLMHIISTPKILNAFNPYYAFIFIKNHGFIAISTFAAIVLVITGAEALYADIGHFGKKSIRFAWFYIIFPALILNYFGQGALLIHNPASISNPFYNLVPSSFLYPFILLATLATIIASQSIISGIFSISWQAIRLDYLPKMKVIHTSYDQIGQVYVPFINYLMLIFTIITVLIFRTSDNLASAYGVTVTAIMLITTILTALLAYYEWQWRGIKILLIFGGFLLLDLIFIGTNIVKILDGGWFPVCLTISIFMIILTWRKGREIMANASIELKHNLQSFISDYLKKYSEKIPGTAIFMCRSSETIPSAFYFNLQHNKFLHEKIIFISIITNIVPKILDKERIEVINILKDIYQVNAYYGFMEVPNLNNIVEKLKEYDTELNIEEASFYLSRGIPISSTSSRLKGFQEKLFIFLTNNAMNATDFFKIPYSKVIELGIRFKI